MPTVSLKKQHYDAIVRMGFEPSVVVNHLMDVLFSSTDDVKIGELKQEVFKH